MTADAEPREPDHFLQFSIFLDFVLGVPLLIVIVRQFDVIPALFVAGFVLDVLCWRGHPALVALRLAHALLVLLPLLALLMILWLPNAIPTLLVAIACAANLLRHLRSTGDE